MQSMEGGKAFLLVPLQSCLPTTLICIKSSYALNIYGKVEFLLMTILTPTLLRVIEPN